MKTLLSFLPELVGTEYLIASDRTIVRYIYDKGLNVTNSLFLTYIELISPAYYSCVHVYSISCHFKLPVTAVR